MASPVHPDRGSHTSGWGGPRARTRTGEGTQPCAFRRIEPATFWLQPGPQPPEPHRPGPVVSGYVSTRAFGAPHVPNETRPGGPHRLGEVLDLTHSFRRPPLPLPLSCPQNARRPVFTRVRTPLPVFLFPVLSFSSCFKSNIFSHTVFQGTDLLRAVRPSAPLSNSCIQPRSFPSAAPAGSSSRVECPPPPLTRGLRCRTPCPATPASEAAVRPCSPALLVNFADTRMWRVRNGARGALDDARSPQGGPRFLRQAQCGWGGALRRVWRRPAARRQGSEEAGLCPKGAQGSR